MFKHIFNLIHTRDSKIKEQLQFCMVYVICVYNILKSATPFYYFYGDVFFFFFRIKEVPPYAFKTIQRI